MSDHADIVHNALSWCEEGEMGNRHRAAGLAALDALVAERDALQAFKDEALQTDWIARAEAAEADLVTAKSVYASEFKLRVTAEAEVARLREALTGWAAQAQDILDTLASGSEPWAASAYGYEHMGDYTRDVKPLCESLVAAPTKEGE